MGIIQRRPKCKPHIRKTSAEFHFYTNETLLGGTQSLSVRLVIAYDPCGRSKAQTARVALILPFTARQIQSLGMPMMREKMSEPHHSIARLMGFGGLVPFIGCAALMFSGSPGLGIVAVFANAVYGGMILSFVGAVHWGLAMREDRSPYWYVWSITPALLGWLAIVLLDIRISLLALSVAFTLAWSVDRQAHMRQLVPDWYMHMRHILTVGATVSLLVTAFAPSFG
jgi:hypothetical protein